MEVMRKFSEQYARRSGTYFCVDKGVTSVVIKVYEAVNPFRHVLGNVFTQEGVNLYYEQLLLPSATSYFSDDCDQDS